MKREKLTPEQEAIHAGWRYRAIEATHGNQSKLGAILLAILGHPAKSPPWFGPSAVITSDGYVLSNFVDRENTMHEGAFVGEVKELVDNLRGLSDHLGLNDVERGELFAETRKWISKDYRQGPSNLENDK